MVAERRLPAVAHVVVQLAGEHRGDLLAEAAPDAERWRSSTPSQNAKKLSAMR
jgi:hypothetical protein